MIENENLVRFISRALDSIGITNVPVRIEKPKDLSHGDLACTVAMQCARALKRNPREIAASLVEAMKKRSGVHTPFKRRADCRTGFY